MSSIGLTDPEQTLCNPHVRGITTGQSVFEVSKGVVAQSSAAHQQGSKLQKPLATLAFVTRERDEATRTDASSRQGTGVSWWGEGCEQDRTTRYRH